MLTDAPGPGGARTKTVPPQLLPGYAKRPDVMLITGWPAHELARSPPRFPPPGAASVVLIPLEFSFCHDHFIPDRVAEKRSKYADVSSPVSAPAAGQFMVWLTTPASSQLAGRMFSRSRWGILVFS